MRTSTRSIAILVAVAVGVASFIGSAIGALAMVARDFAFKVVAGPVLIEAKEWRQTQALPTIDLTRGRAFVARFVKRDRPRMTDGWRLCPSV